MTEPTKREKIMSKIDLGRGSGNTRLTVHGTIESIETVQNKLKQLDRLKATLRDIAYDPCIEPREAIKLLVNRENIGP